MSDSKSTAFGKRRQRFWQKSEIHKQFHRKPFHSMQKTNKRMSYCHIFCLITSTLSRFHKRRFSCHFFFSSFSSGKNCRNATSQPASHSASRHHQHNVRINTFRRGDKQRVENREDTREGTHIQLCELEMRKKETWPWTIYLFLCQTVTIVATAATIYLSISRWIEKRTALNLILAGSRDARTSFHSSARCSGVRLFGAAYSEQSEHNMPKQSNTHTHTDEDRESEVGKGKNNIQFTRTIYKRTE